MKLVVGLGNPGEKYKNNRHNVGHIFVDSLTEEIEASSPKASPQSGLKSVKAMKTDCFMNESGKFVAEKANFFKIKPDDLFIVHDDLDIPLGKFKIQLGVGPKVNNGIASIETALNSAMFWRVRIGVDSRVKGAGEKLGDSGREYVLGDFTASEIKELHRRFPKILEELEKRLLK